MKVLSIATSPADCAECIRQDGVQTVCVSALPPAAFIPARNLCKRLKQQDRALKIVAGIWSPKATPTELQKRLGPWADAVPTRLKDAVDQLTGHTEHTAPSQDTVTFHLDSAEPEEARDAVIRELAKIFDVPVSLVSVNISETESERPDSICNQLESMKDLVVVEDVAKDTKFSENTFLQERGVKFLASVPLHTTEGDSVGSLCIMDTRPHTVTERQRLLLQKVAEEFMRVLGRRRLQAA